MVEWWDKPDTTCDIAKSDCSRRRRCCWYRSNRGSHREFVRPTTWPPWLQLNKLSFKRESRRQTAVASKKVGQNGTGRIGWSTQSGRICAAGHTAVNFVACAIDDAERYDHQMKKTSRVNAGNVSRLGPKRATQRRASPGDLQTLRLARKATKKSDKAHRDEHGRG